MLSAAIRAQNLEILRRGQAVPGHHPKSIRMDLLDPAIDSGDVEFLATIRARIKDNKKWGTTGWFLLYNDIQMRAERQFRANVFRVRDYSRSDTGRYASLTLDVYYSSDSVSRLNASKKQRNMLYVWPEPVSYDPKKEYAFKLNGAEVKLRYLQYFKLPLRDGDKVVLSKGNMDYVVRGKAGGQPVYLVFYGCCGVTPTFTTGSFNKEDQGFAELLLHTLFREAVMPGGQAGK
jgi:hypothetical protein